MGVNSEDLDQLASSLDLHCFKRELQNFVNMMMVVLSITFMSSRTMQFSQSAPHVHTSKAFSLSR